MNKWLILGLFAITAPVYAQDAAPAADSETATLGRDARAWLDLQKNPAAQVPEVRAVPGEVSEQVYQRYVNSFKYTIPEKYDREGFTSSGGGGGK